MKSSYYSLLVALTATIGLVSTSTPCLCADYTIDASHSRVGFEVRHMMISDVDGMFKDFEGSFKFDEKKPQESTVDLTAKTSSINTDWEKRDEHLRSPEFFDVEKYPTLSFHGKKLTPSGQKKYKLEGDLTIHGVTKPVVFQVEYKGGAKDPWGNNRVAFNATSRVDRKDYGLNWNKKLDGGGVLIGDTVAINLKIEAIEKK